MNWKLKGLIQKGLCVVPGGRNLNDRLQRGVGELRHFERNVAAKVEDWRLSLRYLQDVDFDVRGKTLVEIGTGWHPALPICFSLAGAKRIITFDIVRHLDEDLTFRMIESLEGHLESIAHICRNGGERVRRSYQELHEVSDIQTLLNRAQVEYCAPTDARATRLPSDSVDLVYSNSVLEHVPKDVILGLMRESFRILRPGGLALHNVACNDHYALMDPAISSVNFLQFNESQWHMWNNALQYQNRLRASEFLELATMGGLEVIYKQVAVRPGTYEALAKLEVAPQFKRFSSDDLAVTSVDFIAKRPD
jgi:SAM-dependent methyltransferase